MKAVRNIDTKLKVAKKTSEGENPGTFRGDEGIIRYAYKNLRQEISRNLTFFQPGKV